MNNHKLETFESLLIDWQWSNKKTSEDIIAAIKDLTGNEKTKKVLELMGFLFAYTRDPFKDLQDFLDECVLPSNICKDEVKRVV